MKPIFTFSIRMLANYSRNRSFFSNKDDLVICKSFMEKKVLDEPALAQKLKRKPQNILMRWMYHILPSMKNIKDLRSNEFLQELTSKINELEKNPYDGISHRFTKEEDEKILKLVEKYGTDWHLISEEMKPRSAHAIYSRYSSYLKYGLKSYQVPFTKEEDDIIKRFMENSGKTIKNKWSHLSQLELPERSPSLLRLRWRELNTDSSPFTIDDYKLFVKSLASHGPDFHLISREYFPNKYPNALRNLWIHGMRKLVHEFFTFKWTRDMDQKLIDCSIAKGFDQDSIGEDFPLIYDKAEIRYRIRYLFALLPPAKNSTPYFPFDIAFENSSSSNSESNLAKIRKKLDIKIPKDLMIFRLRAFNRKIEEPFTEEDDKKLLALIEKSLQNDPMGNFKQPKAASHQNQQRVLVEVKQVITWKDISINLNRNIQDCKNRWTQLKYDYYQI